jgi:hypothetical protein
MAEGTIIKSPNIKETRSDIWGQQQRLECLIPQGRMRGQVRLIPFLVPSFTICDPRELDSAANIQRVFHNQSLNHRPILSVNVSQTYLSVMSYQFSRHCSSQLSWPEKLTTHLSKSKSCYLSCHQYPHETSNYFWGKTTSKQFILLLPFN